VCGLPFLLRHIKAYGLILQKQAIRAPGERIGVVVIGRNEGSRLARCLRSVISDTAAVVYVDSGSSDDSVALAHSMGVGVVELARNRPFTAARARNAGLEYLYRTDASLAWVQFVDGDCEVNPVWWHTAWSILHAREEFAIVCGRIRERHPECSVFTRLCDIEWDAPTGEVEECGGTFMARVSALRQVGGFNPDFIAGEEPEMCVRLRQQSWKVLRIKDDMALHEAGMVRVSQWWRREVRGGYAVAEGAATHGHLPERHRVHILHRNWLWGLIMPIAVVVVTALIGPKGLWLLAAYLTVPWRTYRALRRRRIRPEAAGLYAVFCTLGKFPQTFGQLRYWCGRLLARPSLLIEYKPPSGAPVSLPGSVQATPSLSKE
jgi:GT2 family glycosyltransferase